MLSLWLLPSLPILGAVVMFLPTKFAPLSSARFLRIFSSAVLTATLALAVTALVVSLHPTTLSWGPTLQLALELSPISGIMIVLVPTIAIPVLLYATSSMSEDVGLPRLIALLVGFCGAMELLVLASDFLTLLLAWELVGAASWALIGFDWRDNGTSRSALQAFITTRVGDLGLYLAAAALFAGTSTFSFSAVGQLSGTALSVVVGGVMFAAAAKSAQLPFSPWLFSAMAGPTAASALLHSATMVAAGAYLIARLAPVLSLASWFAPAVIALGLSTAIAGGLVALIQSDLKRALAASTSAQYGLMLVAVGAGVPAAAALHLIAHAAFKALLFLGAGIVLHSAGTLDMSKLRLGAALPRVARLFGIGTLALAAVPPLGGAFSKEQILAAAETGPRGGGWIVAGVLVAGFLSALYAGRLYLLAFGKSEPTARSVAPSRIEYASIGALALVSVALGLLWMPGADGIFERVSGSALADGNSGLLLASLATIVFAAFIDWRLWRTDNLFELAVPDLIRRGVEDWLGLPALAQRFIVQPVYWFSTELARFDQRWIDAGISAVASFTSSVSRVFAWWGENGMDGVVSATAAATGGIATASRTFDDSAIDRFIEGLARGVGVVGSKSRRLQTGLSHDYYTIVAIGAAVILAVAGIARYVAVS